MKSKRLLYIFRLILIILIFPISTGFFSWLYYMSKISLAESITLSSTFLGFIILFIIAFIQLRITRIDNQEIKKEELRKSLQINALSEINKAANNLSNVLSEASNYFSLSLTLKLILHRFYLKRPELPTVPDGFKFDKEKVYVDISNMHIKINGAKTGYIIAWESNEIILIIFKHFRLYIQLEFQKLDKAINEFLKMLREVEVSELLTEQGTKSFKEECNKVTIIIDDINSYLYDCRIELMNGLLGDLFSDKVERRKPHPPHKTLIELADKEKVAKLWGEMGRKILESKKENKAN